MGGAFNPSPSSFGAEAGHIEEFLLDALLEGQGTALADDVDSYMWAERFAESRCLAYLWHLNARFAGEWDPTRTTDFLPRWERIYGLTPLATDTLVDRRAALLARVQQWGLPPTRQVVNDLLTLMLGPAYVEIVNSSSATATGTVPGGCTVPGGVTLADGDWISSIAYVAILTVQPATWTDAQFYAAVGRVRGLLDDLLPGWATFDWVRDGSSEGEFILDDEHNLDNERLST